MIPRALWILLFLLFCWLRPLGAQPLTSCSGEKICIRPATASLQKWMEWVEKEKNITLSYNASLLDMDGSVTLHEADTVTVAELLVRLLPDFKLSFQENQPRKLMLQIEPRARVILQGDVREEITAEKLDDAFVGLQEIHTGKTYTALTVEGLFSLSILEGEYRMHIQYVGYHPYQRTLSLHSAQNLRFSLKPLSIKLQETTVRPQMSSMELDESMPTNKLTFTNANVFSQLNILPGVIGSPMGIHFQVNGGGDDENLLLMDGVPLYHYGHMNTMMSPFNGDAIKSVTFHRSFFPTQFEGRLSSVTEVKMKEGNKQEHVRTLSLDMPAASAVLEGPIVKNKLSYIVGARRSWLDFFDELVNDNLRMNHSYWDYNAKLSWDITPNQSMQVMTYRADDRYYYPSEDESRKKKRETAMKWTNQIYQLGYNALIGKKFSFTSSLSYTYYSNQAQVGDVEYEGMKFLKSGIKSGSLMAAFHYQQESIYQATWGMRLSRDIYEMAVFGDTMTNRNEPVKQMSLFYDNLIRISPKLSVQVGVNYVVYAPDHYKNYQSIQPRLMLKYSWNDRNLLYASASRMEQFYHYICLNDFALPTDFRMPSIGKFKPRSSEHYEAGWKRFLSKGYCELSAFFKTRRNVLALRPEIFPADDQWSQYIMAGNGESYGAKAYLTQSWKRFSIQASYAYIRSKEKFTEFKELGKLPSLYDVPHAFATAVSYRLGKYSSVSIGGEIRSGRVHDMDEDQDFFNLEDFRRYREPLMYRLDAGYGYQRMFKKALLVFRVGLYNIVGNPPEEEIQYFYFVNYYRHCLPYATISFKF